MELPDKSKLESLYQKSKSDPESGLPKNGWYYSSSEYNITCAWYMNFSSGETTHALCKDRGFSDGINVMCVGD